MILFGTALPEKNGCQNHDAFSSVGSLRSHGTGAIQPVIVLIWTGMCWLLRRLLPTQR